MRFEVWPGPVQLSCNSSTAHVIILTCCQLLRTEDGDKQDKQH